MPSWLSIKNQEISLDLPDFTLQEGPEDNLMVVIPQAWYNDSYTMAAAKPIKSLITSLYNDPFFNNNNNILQMFGLIQQWQRIPIILDRC